MPNEQTEREPGKYGEPWELVDDPRDPEEPMVRLADGRTEYDLDDNGGQIRPRIVACVNACEGIEDPAAVVALLRLVAECDPDTFDSYEEGVCFFCRVRTSSYTGGGR